MRRGIGTYYAYRKELNEFRSGIDLASQYDPMTDPIFLHWKANYYDTIARLSGKVIGVMRDYCRQNGINLIFAIGAENGGDKLVHGSGGISQPRAE